MKVGFTVCLIAGVVLTGAASAVYAQTAPRNPNDPPPMLVIAREEVKAGKTAAHTANELAWAGMMAKASWPTGWLGMTSITGPNEAWFFTGFASMAEWEKDRNAQDAAEALRDNDKYSAQDGELLNRTSTLIGVFRPAMSHQPTVSLPKMRYFSIDTVVVKAGHTAEFAERWRAIVDAHTKGKVDEHWAVYEITSGAADGTFLFIYPMESLTPIDASGAKHRDSGYRDAMGEAGRAKNDAMTQNAIVSEQNRIFAFNPKMSWVGPDWATADPFWAPPAPAPAPTPKKK